MHYIYLKENTVAEIIPDTYPSFPGVPATQRYSPEFLRQCVTVEDVSAIKCGMIYDGETFTVPPEPEPIPEPEPSPEPEPTPDQITQVQLAVAELAAQVETENTANQLAIAELAATVLGGEA